MIRAFGDSQEHPPSLEKKDHPLCILNIFKGFCILNIEYVTNDGIVD